MVHETSTHECDRNFPQSYMQCWRSDLSLHMTQHYTSCTSTGAQTSCKLHGIDGSQDVCMAALPWRKINSHLSRKGSTILDASSVGSCQSTRRRELSHRSYGVIRIAHCSRANMYRSLQQQCEQKSEPSQRYGKGEADKDRFRRPCLCGWASKKSRSNKDDDRWQMIT